MTSDVDGAKNYYSTLFGWKTEDMPMGDMNYTIVKVGEEGLGGIMTVPPQAEGTPPNWGVYVTVNDVDATAAKAEDLGGKVLVPPTDIPTVGRFCVLQVDCKYRTRNVEVRYSVSLIFLTGSTRLRKKASPRHAGSTG